MRHFESLQQQMIEMESRYRAREHQLQQLIRRQSIATQDGAAVTEELARWKSLVGDKNREIDRFRVELDAILEVVRRLQSHGVVVQCPGGVTGDRLT